MSLLVIGAIPAVARAAATLPGDVIHVQLPGEPPLARSDGDATTVFTTDFREIPAFLAFLDGTIKPLGPTAVVSVTEAGLEPAAAAAEHLGVTGVAPEVVRVTRNKLAMRYALAARAPHLNPDFAAGDDPEAVARLFEEHARVVVKPVDGSGSTAVQLLTSATDLAPERRTATVVLEQFVDWREFSVDAMSSGGHHTIVGIAQKGTTDGFVEISHVMPPVDFGDRDRKLVERAVSELLDAVGLTDGPSHTEVRTDGDRVAVIETHNRTGGDGIAELVRLTTGIDWRRAALGWAIGETLLRGVAAPVVAAAARVFFTASPGRVVAVAPQPRLAHGTIVDWQVTVRPGDLVPALRSSADRLGVATVTAGSAAECAAAVAELTALPIVTTEPTE